MPSIKPQSPHMFVFGFGVDLSKTDDYKLVRLVYRVEIKHCMMEFMWSQAFVNGVVHWIAYDVVANGGGLWSLVMTCSIADEVFGEIMLPDALVSVIPMNLSIMLFEESLVVRYEREIDDASCEVWVMKQYGVLESWSRLYRINLVADMEKVVRFRNNGEVLFSTRSNDLISYDPNSGRNMGLCIQGSYRSFYVQNYMESLILLKGNNAVLSNVVD
ncbi:hypothetical protein KY284_005092 [Solanum tuberosum]|nr:hypothetical protein KY284_005092 [Solanum tuberosum]